MTRTATTAARRYIATTATRFFYAGTLVVAALSVLSTATVAGALYGSLALVAAVFVLNMDIN